LETRPFLFYKKNEYQVFIRVRQIILRANQSFN
jgi:hypothetical protein